MHLPVLKKEVLIFLNPQPGQNFIDATVGEGGHAFSILEKIGPRGKLLGIDRDQEIIHNLEIKAQKLKLKNRLILVCQNFSNLKKIAKTYNFFPVHGILFDLGISSWHLEQSQRGFTFKKDEPLDMRYSPKTQKLSAKEILNFWPPSRIEKILKEFGEERFAKKIAKEIEKERKIVPIETTFQLVKIVKKATPGWYQQRKIHPATKTFQALRIAINQELENLKKALPQALEILEKGGRVVIISFHSLEDRIVKNFLKDQSKLGKIKILTKKPVLPTSKEIKLNPRSRSAKLRAAIKL